jgi:hypothetical protein
VFPVVWTIGKYECSIMAITKVSGETLESNLIRVTNLAVNEDTDNNTALLFFDVANNRLGVNTNAPGNFALDVNGNTRIVGDLTVQGTTTTIDSQNLTVEDNIITLNDNASGATDAGIMINRTSQNNAVLYWDETIDKFRIGTTPEDGSTRTDFTNVTLSNLQIADPVADADAATKLYVDDAIATVSSSGITGDNVELRLPSDSTFGDGAYLGLTSSTSVTQAIDDLNETMSNIERGTYLKSVSFIADTQSISEGEDVTLTITTVPTAGANTRYTITWGDGDTTTGTSDSTPTHTYNTGGTYSVTVKAFENDALVTDSSGSFATNTETDFIAVATPAPVVGFTIHSTDDSANNPITTADTGSTVYLENTTTNSVADCTYEVDWGDGTSNAIANNSVDGGVSGGRLAHTYTNSPSADDSSVAGTGPGDTKYRIRLTLLSHSTAAPEQIPQSADANFEVYSTHTVAYSVADSTIRGVNEEATSGFPVTFTNDTATLPGSNSDFSATQRYSWDFGEGAGATLVNVGSGSPGDTGQTISNTFNLSSGEQSAGTTQTYTTSVSLANGHSSSPFSANLNIIVEPDVRANIAGTAVTVSTGSSDNQYSLYDHTDLDGNVRSLARFTNTSQNADDYFYDYYDDSSSTLAIVEDGSTAGVVGVTVDKDYTGASNGNINFRFRAHGTPDTIEQDDEEILTFVMKAVPSAPAGLSSKSLDLTPDSAQGTTPKLCAGFDDNTGAADTLSAGDSLTTSTARRYTTTTTIDTNTVTNFYNGATGTLAAEINASDDGTKTFTSAENETGTFTSLVVSSNVDYDTVVGSYPQRFYLVASAKITKNLSAYTVGVNAQRLTHTTTGDTNYVHVVKDDITARPTTTIGTISEGTQGTYRYVSGIPYYNTGSPTLTISGTTVLNFTGQAYQDAADPHEVDPGTNQESTSGNVIAETGFTYANIDGASSMLTGGIPNTDTGVGSAYTLGDLTVNIASSPTVKSVQQIKARSKNANGTELTYSESSTKIQVYTSALSGLDIENNPSAGGITVSDSLGATFDDDAVRISGLGSLSGDTPSLFDSSNANYYTDHAWSGAVTVAGTNEAITRFGTIKHFTTDLSSGYLPAGPDLATGRDGGEAQYYTFAFRRTTMANFTVRLTGTVSGCFIAAPGTAIDSASTLNGWLDASITYGGSGVPGADTGNGGNGSNGCAFTSGDRIIDGTSYSNQTFTLTLGSENATNATGNNILVRFKLESGDSITALSIE